MKARAHFAAKGQRMAAQGYSRMDVNRATAHLPHWAWAATVRAYDDLAYAMRVRLMAQAMRPWANPSVRIVHGRWSGGPYPSNLPKGGAS